MNGEQREKLRKRAADVYGTYVENALETLMDDHGVKLGQLPIEFGVQAEEFVRYAASAVVAAVEENPAYERDTLRAMREWSDGD